MDLTLTLLLTIGGGTAGYYSIIKLIVPQLSKLFKYLSDRKHKNDIETIDVNKELIETKESSNKMYEQQITFFISQLEVLQKQLLRKTDELIELTVQCDELRCQLLSIQKELFQERQKNNELINKWCGNTECQYRIKKNNENK